jgi:hypothetical protein
MNGLGAHRRQPDELWELRGDIPNENEPNCQTLRREIFLYYVIRSSRTGAENGAATAPLWRPAIDSMKLFNIRTPKHGRARARFFHVLMLVKLIALELAATILFLVWIFRELIHELRR